MYWERVYSLQELLGDEGLLRLPSYLPESFVIDDLRKNIIKSAVNLLTNGQSVLLVGSPGTGKTALMFMILRELVDKGVAIGYILEGATTITNDHLIRGIILFYDDLPRMNHILLKSLINNRIKGIIATARKEELPLIKKITGVDISSIFHIYEIGSMKEEKLKEMLFKYLENENVSIKDKEAIDIIVKKSNGLPVYIWQVIRDLRIKNSPLTIEFAKKIPQGMYDYVDEILWRVIGESRDRYSVLLTLLVMSDLPRYSIHQDVYNAFFVKAKEDLTGERTTIRAALLSDVLDSITRYLAREAITYSFRLPHDSWADVLKGRSSGLMSGEISRINTVYPDEKRKEILLEAVKLAWNEVISKTTDEARKRAFLDFVENVFGESNLREITKIKRAREKIWYEIQASELLKMLDLAYSVSDVRKIIRDFNSYSRNFSKDEKIKFGVRLIKKGLSLRSNEIINEGINILSEIDDPKAYYNLGVIYLKKRDYKKAFEMFQISYQRNYGPNAIYNLAVALIGLGNIKEAEKYLLEYLKMAPNDLKAKRAINEIKKIKNKP